jgi:hypothetical protein
MRAFGILGLVIALAIVGLLVKKQLTGASAASGTTAATQNGVVAPTGTPKQQVDQVKQQVELQMQQSRPVTDEAK